MSGLGGAVSGGLALLGGLWEAPLLPVIALASQELFAVCPSVPQEWDLGRQAWVWEVTIGPLKGTAFSGVGLGLPFSF